MANRTELPPDQQIQKLAEQMRILRVHHVMAQSGTIEALARSRELLAVPVYKPRTELGRPVRKAK